MSDFVLVPREPTEEMHNAFYAAEKGNFLTRYAAMLTAAPRTAQEQDASIDTALHLFRGEQISFGKMMEIAHAWRKGEPFTLPSNIQASSDLDALVDRFLAWPLPESVCSDQCATHRGYPHRTGTNLLTDHEARQMLEYLLSATSLSPQAGVSEEILTRVLSSEVLGIEYDSLYENKQEWIDDRGSRHDINMPFRRDIREAAKVVMAMFNTARSRPASKEAAE